MEKAIVDNARITENGQITLPKDIRDALGVKTGDRVVLVRKDDQVMLVNGAVYAMRELQEAMKGEAEKAGLHSEEDADELVWQLRRGEL